MMSFWRNLVPREKVLVVIAIALFVLIFGWALVLKPVLAYPQDQKTIYQQSQSHLKILRTGRTVLAGEIQVAKTDLPVSEVQSTITKSATAHGLSISRRQPNGETGVSLWFENANGPQFYAWVEELTNTYNIILLRAGINRNEDGTLRAQITFEVEA